MILKIINGEAFNTLLVPSLNLLIYNVSNFANSLDTNHNNYPSQKNKWNFYRPAH